MRTTIGAVCLAAVVALTLSACGADADPEGDWGSEADGQPNLTLAEDGKVSGTDGCNRLMTTWEEDGDEIAFGDVAGTLLACVGVDRWLSAMASATVDGDTLVVRNEAGDEIGTLDRR
jgi:heat shock protein HslJ